MSRLGPYATIEEIPDSALQLRVTILAVAVADMRRNQNPRLAAWEADFNEAVEEFQRRGQPTPLDPSFRARDHQVADDDGMAAP